MSQPESVLARLRRLEAAASPLFWRVKPGDEYNDACVVLDEGDGHDYRASWAEIPNVAGDVPFIVAVRNAWPLLLGGIEAATAMQRAYTMNASQCADAADALAFALAELERPG